MTKKKNYPCRTPFREDGWVLAFVLLLLVAIQALAMASLSIVKHQMKSSLAFYHISRNNHYSTRSGTTPTETRSQLTTPEGWDHTCFSTELKETIRGNEHSYSWRIVPGETGKTCTDDVMLSSSRPYIILVVDDSENMNKSCGMDYVNESLYLKRASGEIVTVSGVSEVAESASAPAGTYFSGRYGNTHFRASALGTMNGALSGWPLAYSYARSLLDSLELSEIAIMSTSRGTIQGFTHDHKLLLRAMDSLHPSSSEAKLAEALYQATTMFPEGCATERHILLATSGVAVNDGHVPEWLKDFDHDGNPNDTAIREEGSHCLDDVSAYALSRGIRVHTVGPDTAFLQSVASKGGGRYMPGRDIFAPVSAFVTQPMVICEGRELFPVHNHARFDPPWLRTGSFTSYRPGMIDPTSLVACPDLSIQGLAGTLAVHGSGILCSTFRDTLMGVSMPSGELSWLIAGVGGIVLKRADRIVAGPNSSGMIFCLDDRPVIHWIDQGELFDASQSTAYIAEGSSITARRIGAGSPIAGADTGRTVTSLRYDPVMGILFAGTRDGLLFLYSPDLIPSGVIPSGMSDAALDIRPFTWRKKACIVVMGNNNVACCTADKILWSLSVDEGRLVSCLVMDRKLYLLAWQEGGPCGGIDTGSSMLLILDAVTGERSGTKVLFPGKAFGPTFDLTRKCIVYTSWNGTAHEEDVSGLMGISWYPAGRRIARPDS